VAGVHDLYFLSMKLTELKKILSERVEDLKEALGKTGTPFKEEEVEVTFDGGSLFLSYKDGNTVCYNETDNKGAVKPMVEQLSTLPAELNEWGKKWFGHKKFKDTCAAYTNWAWLVFLSDVNWWLETLSTGRPELTQLCQRAKSFIYEYGFLDKYNFYSEDRAQLVSLLRVQQMLDFMEVGNFEFSTSN